MSRSSLEYLRHILDEMTYLVERSQGLSKSEFLQDTTLTRAFVRSLEIIGEAIKNVPEDLRRKHAHIDWRAMAGMRDRLIHAYFGVDYDIVWDVVTNKVPLLRQEIQHIVEEEGKS
ncbi:MAG TPA: DUF86 domain-containing protein [Anaerolineae bacterium]